MNRKKRVLRDVLGLDFAGTGVKAVRLKGARDGILLAGAAILPFHIEGEEAWPSGRRRSRPFSIPGHLMASSVAITSTAPDATLKMLSFAGAPGPGTDVRLAKEMGVERSENERFSYRVVRRDRNEFTVVAAAMPSDLAETLLGFFSTGLPAPCTLELSACSTITAFLSGSGRAFSEHCVGMLDFGYSTSTFAVLNQCNPVLIRRFTFGRKPIEAQLTAALNVEPSLAQAMLTHPALDLIPCLQPVLQPIVKQIAISRGFVERKVGANMTALLVAGSLAYTPGLTSWLAREVGSEVKPWNPLDCLSNRNAALPEVIRATPWRFSAAIGAAIGVMNP